MIPFTFQVTDEFVVFVTVSTKSCVAPRTTETFAGETLTPTTSGGGGFGDVTPQDERSNMQSTEKTMNMIPIKRVGGLPIESCLANLRL